MPCGCRKNPNTRAIRSAKVAKAKQKARLAEKARLKAARKHKDEQRLSQRKAKYDLIIIKLNMCKSCPHSKQSPLDKKRLVRICHKLDRLIKEISADANSVCPIRKF